MAIIHVKYVQEYWVHQTNDYIHDLTPPLTVRLHHKAPPHYPDTLQRSHPNTI